MDGIKIKRKGFCFERVIQRVAGGQKDPEVVTLSQRQNKWFYFIFVIVEISKI
jgi:hypothetical protein